MRGTSIAILVFTVALSGVVACSRPSRWECGASPTSAPGSALNGSYRFVFRREDATAEGSPFPKSDESYSMYWAFRSVCKSSGWVATATKLDMKNPSIALSPGARVELQFDDDHWRQNRQPPNRFQQMRDSCLGVDGKIGPGSDTVDATMTLEAHGDGTVVGVETRTVITDECGWMGTVITAPFKAERIGDVPAGVSLVEPMDITRSATSSEPPTTAAEGPELNGKYRLEFDNEHGTLDNSPNKTSNRIQLYAFRSSCSPSSCVATGELLDRKGEEPVGSPEVLTFVDGEWTEQPKLFWNKCGSGGWATRALALRPQQDGELKGTTTVTIRTAMDSECAAVGAVLKSPTAATRISDVPSTVVLADPALFF